jgi:hypothetical protein
MPSYPEPRINPACRCNAMQAFLCPVGHMLECHYPYPCDQAGCSHLTKYDLELDEAVRLQAEALARLTAGKLPPYCLDADGQVCVQSKEGLDVTA